MPRKKKDKNQLDLTKRHYDTTGAFINNAPILENVSANIKQHITTDVYKKLKKTEAGQEHKVHSAQGKTNADKGAYVFEFRTAGSGNNQWNKIYRGFNGHNEDIKLTPIKAEFGPEQNYFDEIANNMKQKYHLDFNTVSDEEIAEKLEEEYGAPLYIDSNNKLQTQPGSDTAMLSGVRIKTDYENNKIVANLSGPMGSIAGKWIGSRDTGEYSIDNLKSYMLQLADNWLSEVREQKRLTGDKNPVYIYMQGHSRGGVATAEASAMIEYLIQKKYPDLKNQVRMDVRLYDPVPGTDSHSNHESINHNKKSLTVHGGKNGIGIMNDEGKNRNDLTVLYSIHSNHDTHFKPMAVTGAKRVILSPRDHDMGIYDVAETDSKLHKKGFIDGQSGDEYRGTGIHDLKEGLFLLDENNILIEVKNQQEAHRFLDSVYIDKSDYWQRTRHLTMYSVVDEWFTRHKDEITKNDTRFAPKKAMSDDIKMLKQYLMNKDDFADPEGMKSRVMASLFAHAKLFEMASKDPLRLTQDAFEKYARMSADDKLTSQIESDPRFKHFISGLKDESIEDIVNTSSISRVFNDFNSFVNTALPETGKDLINKNLGEAQANLTRILASEVADNPNQHIPDADNLKRSTVANIIVNRIVNDIAKKDPASNTVESKDKYAQYIKSAEAQVVDLLKDADFIRFYENMKPEDIQQLAIGGGTLANKVFSDFISSRDMNPMQKALEDAKLIRKLAGDIYSNKAFFKEKLDEDGEIQPEFMTKELKESTRTGHIAVRICAMLQDGYKFEDIMDPYKLSDKKQKYGEMTFDKATTLKNNVDACKAKLSGKRPLGENETMEIVTQDYIDAETKKIAQAELYKEGMKKALEYVDQKMKGMKNISIAELSKPENRDLYAVIHLLQDLAQDVEAVALKNPLDGTFIDPEFEELSARQVGLNILMTDIVDKTVEFSEAISNPDSIAADEIISKIVKLKSNENLANEVLTHIHNTGAKFTETVKQGTKVCQQAAKMDETPEPEVLGFNKYLKAFQSEAMAKKVLFAEVLTNSKAFSNVNKSGDKTTVKTVVSELNRIKKLQPVKENVKEANEGVFRL